MARVREDKIDAWFSLLALWHRQLRDAKDFQSRKTLTTLIGAAQDELARLGRAGVHTPVPRLSRIGGAQQGARAH